MNKLFLVFGFSFLGGVFMNNISSFSLLSIIVLGLFGILLLNTYIYLKQYRLLSILLILGGLLGVFVSYLSLSGVQTHLGLLDKYYNKEVHIQVEVKGVYQLKDFEQEYRVELLELENNTQFREYNIVGLVSVPSNFSVKKGDILEIREKILPIKNFAEGFNYEKYLHSKNIFFKLQAKSIRKVGKVEQNIVIQKIDKTRENFLSAIHILYPKEEALFLGGILVGARENLPKDLKQDFNNSGLTHFIAVSGFNITILVVFLGYILQYFPVVVRLVVITLSIVGFTLLVGDAAPVIRASIMGLLAYYIMLSGRDTHNISLLLITAIIMILFSPLSLNYDVSLHLSFLAVIGIIYTQDFFKKIFFFLPETLAVKEAFILTLSALSFALPIMLFNFGQLPLFSPIANILVTWTIPLAMLFGFLSIIFYFIVPVIGTLIAYVTWVLLAWDIKIVHFFGGLDWAILQLDFGYYKYSLEILYFIVLIFIVNYFKKK